MTDRWARWEGRGRPWSLLGLPDTVSGGVGLFLPTFGLHLGGLDPLLCRQLLAPGHQEGHVLVEETLHLLSGTNNRRINGKWYAYSAFLTSGHSKCSTILPYIHPPIHPFMHTFTRRLCRQPCKATASWSEAVRLSRLARGHLSTRTSTLLVSSQPALPPGPHTPRRETSWC